MKLSKRERAAMKKVRAFNKDREHARPLTTADWRTVFGMLKKIRTAPTCRMSFLMRCKLAEGHKGACKYVGPRRHPGESVQIPRRSVRNATTR